MINIMMISILLWLAACAYQDYRTGEVSNWLTLTPLVLSLTARLVGWLIVPWEIIGLVWAVALYLWHTEKLGGADAKAWMTFSLLGNGVLWCAYFGLIIWYAAIAWALAYLGFEGASPERVEGACTERVEGTRRFPGFPGYLLGVGGAALICAALILTGGRLFSIMPDVAFILWGHFL